MHGLANIKKKKFPFFIIEADCVLCDIQTEILYEM